MGRPTVKVYTGAHTTVIELRGDVDIACVASLCQALVDALFERRTHMVVVDLVHTTTIDAAGIEALAAAGCTAEEMHVSFALRCPDPLIAAELSNIASI